MKTQLIGFTAACAIALTGCAMEDELAKPSESQTKGGAEGKADAWNAVNDNPNGFQLPNIKYTLADLPQQGEATNIPWAANYWPTYQDNINYRWDGAQSDSPAAKYGKAFGVANIEDKVSKQYGIDRYKGSRTACTKTSECDSSMGESCAKRTGATEGVCIPTWWGICHAWAPLSILKPEPLHGVDYSYTENGEQKTVHFKVNDVKALMELAYNSTRTRFVSTRCNKGGSTNPISWDAYGRPAASDSECKDTNPGTMHILVTNLLGIQGNSFVYDRTFDAEVWNQPLRGYRITKQVEVSAKEANKLVGVTSEGGTNTDFGSSTVAKGAWKHFDKINVSAGDAVTVTMTGTNDADLYVRFGSAPDTNGHDCRPYDNGSDETCEVVVPAGVTELFVAVNGYSSTDAVVDVKAVVGGGIPDAYHFNDKAKKFFHVKMDLDYITESSASTDGNLAADIDRYTHTDHYEYILELKADGTIIGGEYIGESKKNHPDFLWLPLDRRSFSIANGAIDFAKVNEIYELSRQTDQPPTTGGVKELDEAGSIEKAKWVHFGPFAVAPGKTLTATMTGTNDADLYVRKGAKPTPTSHDCRPYKNGSDEACTIQGPGEFYVSVNGWAASSDFDLNIKYTEGNGTTPPVDPPTAVTHLHEQATVAHNGMKRYTIEVRAGEKILVRTFSTKDVDLYIQMNGEPTTAAYLMRGYTSSGNETIGYTPTSNGTLNIMVYGYQAGQFTLKTAAN